MKLYTNRILLLFLSFALLLGACETEESIEITSPDPAFVLQEPGISSIFLNFSLPNNPAFTLTWVDEVTGSSSYDIEMSTDDSFSSVVNLGTSTTNSFSISVQDLNDAITSVVSDNFQDVAIYVRVNAGSTTSNSVLYLVTTYPVDAPSFDGISNGDAFVLSLANNDQVAVTIQWEDAILQSSLGVDVTYYLEAGTTGSDFATVIDVANVVNQNSIALTNAQLNAAALSSGIAPDTAGDLDLRVRSVITDSNTGAVLERTSATLTINVTTYLTVLDLSTTWGIVGSAANNWGATPDLPFWQTDTNGVLAAYVTLTDGEIKFRENNNWAVNYGDTGADGTIEQNGDNIAVTAGSYKVTLNFNDNTYTIEPFSLGIVGSAYNNWGATPDFMLEYDQYSDVFRGIVTLLDGEMKFRMNNDWAVNYGDTGADGTIEQNGDNINVTAGIYIVTVDLNDNEYTLQPIDYVWGLVGSAFNNWGATPDASFTRDWSRPFDDIWILRDVTLLDGEYKIRANNDWAVNYGDTGADGTLELNGNNIVSMAGTYTITLDFSNPSVPTITVD
ncbi:SusE domain-containing protein [Pseudotenacibaculum haliotis]|uniref:SusE domain-containing protein n=1 Tax=Pseudotenacibaculum haliotis TaxID=1862138 RepID=A0ABW5LS01_9FLAO